MARRVITRQAALTNVTGTSATFTIPTNILPPSRPGQALVGLELRMKGATADVADLARVRVFANNERFYDQTILHERLFQERYLKTNRGVATGSGATATTVLDGGGMQIWFNDLRIGPRLARDAMSAPFGDISVEVVTDATAGPAANTVVDAVGIYSDAPVAAHCRRTSIIPNIANNVTGGVAQIDIEGAILAYGVPYTSATLADAVLRWRTYLKRVEIFDGDLGSALSTEADDTPVYDSNSLVATPGTGVVIWKDTAGLALPGGEGSYFLVDTGANAAASLAAVEVPIWSATAVGR